MITHASVMATIASQKDFLDTIPNSEMREDDCYLSFLPLAHIFDRWV